MRTVYINLYRQGWYHRQGKPGTLPFHAGDTYPTVEAAIADIDPEAPYIATVPLQVPVGPYQEGEYWLSPSDFQPYGPDSVPVPLSKSRAVYQGVKLAEGDGLGTPSHIEGMRPLQGTMPEWMTGIEPLETGEADARPYPQPVDLRPLGYGSDV